MKNLWFRLRDEFYADAYNYGLPHAILSRVFISVAVIGVLIATLDYILNSWG